MTLDTSVHKTILFQILKDVYSDTTIAPFLGFKGGTAALMFYDLDRFSVDLDFDLLDEGKEDYVFENVTAIIKKYGTLKESYKKRFNLFCLLSYEDKAHNIKIEINFIIIIFSRICKFYSVIFLNGNEPFKNKGSQTKQNGKSK